MANPTTNFGWVMPTSTDLVTDLPADFAVFGQAVDTSLAELKGGTTGQVLSKTSNTDMDFTWVAQDDSNAIQNAIVDAKGDLITATAADTPARLAIGTNGQTLVADSTASTGLKWAAPDVSATLLSTTTVSGTATTVSSISGAYNHLRIYMTDITANGTTTIMYKVNGITSGYYGFSASDATLTTSTTNAVIGNMGTSGKGNYQFELPNYAVATNMRPVRFFGSNDQSGAQAWGQFTNVGSSAAITSFTLTTTAGTATLTGTIKIYGVTA